MKYQFHTGLAPNKQELCENSENISKTGNDEHTAGIKLAMK